MQVRLTKHFVSLSITSHHNLMVVNATRKQRRVAIVLPGRSRGLISLTRTHQDVHTVPQPTTVRNECKSTTIIDDHRSAEA